MTISGPARIGISLDVKPHAYDPVANPELFEGVLSRRLVAFSIDVLIITVPVIAAAMFIFLFGLVTLGLGWMLFWLMSPASVIWALFYYGVTMGSAASATIGMRAMDIEMRTWYGAPSYFLLGAVHAVVYLGQCQRLDAVHPAGRPVQRPPAPAARHAGRHGAHQQPGAGGLVARADAALTLDFAFDARALSGDLRRRPDSWPAATQRRTAP